MIERIFDVLLSLAKAGKYAYLRWRVRTRLARQRIKSPASQDLEVYDDPVFANRVSLWGSDNVWDEVQLLLVNCHGKVLDIACGTCPNYAALTRFSQLDLHGFDISASLIQSAVKRGVPQEKVSVCDATKMWYGNDAFDYSYSIGSLEHFTEDGILKFLNESSRVTRYGSFHQIPTSRSGQDEGWLTLDQSYFNNSVEWWLKKFELVFETVYVLDSAWEDPISKGKWFICHKTKPTARH